MSPLNYKRHDALDSTRGSHDTHASVCAHPSAQHCMHAMLRGLIYALLCACCMHRCVHCCVHSA
eukprot:1158093-Pelagomonas_calceolata.AAC.3